MGVLELTDDTFPQVTERGWFLVDFWAPWCAPCQELLVPLEMLATRFVSRLQVVKVNIDEHPMTAAQWRVMSLPALLLLHDGKAVEVLVGSRTRHELEHLVNRHLDGDSA
jgi:thioredoxin 1